MSANPLLDALPGMVFILLQDVDNTFKFEYSSQGIESLYSISANQILQDSRVFFERFSQEQRLALTESLIFCAFEQLDCQLILSYYDNTQLKSHYFFAKPQPISGGLTRWHGQIIDRHYFQAEDISHHHNERLLTSLFELSPLGIGLITLKNNQFIKTNTALQRILNRTDVELQDLSLDLLIAEHDAHELQRQWLILQYQQHFEPHEVQYKLSDGSFCDVLINGLRLEDEHGNSLLWVIIEDISQRKVTERQLLIEKDRAEAAASAKSNFLASMSHEIRTPLNGVIGMLDILENTSLTTGQAHQVKIAKNSGQTLLILLNDILDFSKIDAGKVELDIDNVDVQQLLQQVTEPFRYLAKSKDLKFNLFFESDSDFWVRTDELRLRQIMNNLLSNALKFTANGSITVSVKLLHQSDNILLTIDIADTGIGLSASQCEWLFQPFSQADSSTTKAYGGTGLGLAICHRLLQLMGGGITVNSIPQQGATFSLWLSLTKGEEVQQLSVENDVFKNIKLPDNLNILVVDDNSINCEVVRLMLCNMGLDVTLAAHGKQAMDILQQQAVQDQFQLIIMDCMMPVMDGYQATAAIRQGAAGDSYRHIPILALTANALRGDKEKCLAAGMSGYLSKPVTQHSLAKAIAEVLGLEQADAVFSENTDVGKLINQAEPQKSIADSSLYWDRMAFLKSLGQLVAMEKSLVSTFAQSLLQVKIDFNQALVEQNINSLASISHSLKGSSAQMCCFVLAESAKKINQFAKDRDVTKIVAESAYFEQILEQTALCLTETIS